ncbi:MerR family transcriptional regulator [Clostridium estertheticum]|uniref:MerR family transcriptional regulator n=1 Tax=Clostridium estertheticum TaxID=238834 RepID=UPI001C0CC262|nr:MerR family transcriptional regulator [Clostridium estertheticum]MBU3173810.1 MerR family transcriptional regulator [Clostridium estertheticum]
MNEKFNKYFTTGDFAKLCNVKKQTLFHYDDIGIFSPEIRDDNGYRYYSQQQFDLFDVITNLKEINMPLKEIKSYLDNRSPNALIKLFKNKILDIDIEIENLKRIRKLMETKISITEYACIIDYSKIHLEFFDEEYLLLSNSIENVSDNEYFKTLSEHMNYCTLNHINSGYSSCIMINKDNILKGVAKNYSYLYTKLNSKDDVPFTFTKPKGIYCVAYHKGDYNNIDKTYNKILQFLKTSNFDIKKYSYEEFLLDEITVKGYENYLTQISVEVESLIEGENSINI